MKLEHSLMQDLGRIEAFCILYGIKPIEIKTTTEHGCKEWVYFFSDNLGGYTIDGIKASIREKVLEN